MKKLTEQEVANREIQVGITRLQPYNGNCLIKHKYQCPFCPNIFYATPRDIWTKHVNSCGCYRRQTTSNRLRKDMTGLVFGRLTVINYAYTKDKQAFWNCQCICGNTCVILGTSLRRGITKSCGCYRSELTSERSRIDITGQRYGKLVAIRFSHIDKNKSNGTIWLCQCDCGNTKEVIMNSLVQGQTKSCGHCNDPKIGNKFGRLLVIEVIPSLREGCRCICKCECGQIWRGYGSQLTNGYIEGCGCKIGLSTPTLTEEEATIKDKQLGFIRLSPYYNSTTKAIYQCNICHHPFKVRPSNIWSGNTISCGCIRSRGEHSIKLILQNNHILYEREKTFKNLVGDSGKKLRFDFYVSDYNLCIEYQGEQHYNDGRWPCNQLAKTQKYDQVKRDYCQANGIELLEIKYTDYSNIESILKTKLGISNDNSDEVHTSTGESTDG